MLSHKMVILALDLTFNHLLGQRIHVFFLSLIKLLHFLHILLLFCLYFIQHFMSILDFLNFPKFSRIILFLHLVSQTLFIHILSFQLISELVLLIPLCLFFLFPDCLQIIGFILFSKGIDII